MRRLLSHMTVHVGISPISRGSTDAMTGFRTHFPFHDLARVSWYPGHMYMAKGMREALKKVDKCDCVIEVHYARVSYVMNIHILVVHVVIVYDSTLSTCIFTLCVVYGS